MGNLFRILAWLKDIGISPAQLAHLWDDVLAVYSAADMDARVLACIHFATHLKGLVPGTVDDAIIDSLVRLTDHSDCQKLAAALESTGGEEVDDTMIELATDLKAAGIMDLC